MDEKQKQVIDNLQKRLENEQRTQRRMIIFASIFSILSLILFCIDWGGVGLVIALPAVAAWILLFFFRGSVESVSNDLRRAQNDIEKYERIVNTRSIMAQAQIQKNQALHDAQHPRCPMCGSQNTQRISTLSRTASVAAVGLASSKIGKQFECKNCKYKW